MSEVHLPELDAAVTVTLANGTDVILWGDGTYYVNMSEADTLDTRRSLVRRDGSPVATETDVMWVTQWNAPGPVEWEPETGRNRPATER